MSKDIGAMLLLCCIGLCRVSRAL